MGFFKGKKGVCNSFDDVNFRATPEMINFYNAFGFLKIQGFFQNEYQMISERFDHLMIDRFKEVNQPRNYLYPQFIDNDEKLSDLLILPKLNSLISALMGDDFVYKGSDGNIFNNPTPWHRDYLIRTRSAKVLIYLEHNDERSGAIRMIPGTHFVDDSYSSFVGDALTWPEPPVQGGFDEKKKFGVGHNPTVFGGNLQLPQTVVSNAPGDLIIFNHNLVHCTNMPKKPKRRRLLGLHFCVNSKKMNSFDEVTQNEIRTLSLVEMEGFKLEKMFGPYVYNHKSSIVQRMIAPLKELSLKSEGPFNGLYQKQSDASIEFCNRLKSDRFKGLEYVN
jgi:ectoine hydroxylase-related dioxygenase (phytanoyl-CoA dioxygenase family)